MDDPGGSTHSSPPSNDKHVEDPFPHGHKATQCSVVSVYQAELAGAPRTVTVSWSKTLINHSLSVSMERLDGRGPLACKVDLKPWPFWSKKGFKSLELDRHRVDVFWDFRSAKFSSRPEPSGGYYVAVVCDGEVALLLGDCKKEAYKRTKSRPSLADAALLYKRENVFGKKIFSTRVRFGEGGRKEHDVVVESSVPGAGSSSAVRGPAPAEMWISVDGEVLIHVDNLQWKFRGNETVVVERVPVQVFWDVHAWLFGSGGGSNGAAVGLGHAVFVFKPGAPPEQVVPPEGDRRQGGSGRGGSSSGSDVGAASPARGDRMVPEFCFFLYAWKVE